MYDPRGISETNIHNRQFWAMNETRELFVVGLIEPQQVVNMRKMIYSPDIENLILAEKIIKNKQIKL